MREESGVQFPRRFLVGGVQAAPPQNIQKFQGYPPITDVSGNNYLYPKYRLDSSIIFANSVEFFLADGGDCIPKRTRTLASCVGSLLATVCAWI